MFVDGKFRVVPRFPVGDTVLAQERFHRSGLCVVVRRRERPDPCLLLVGEIGLSGTFLTLGAACLRSGLELIADQVGSVVDERHGLQPAIVVGGADPLLVFFASGVGAALAPELDVEAHSAPPDRISNAFRPSSSRPS